MGNLQLSPGSLFANRFEIERAAGSGGMGTVYRARDRYNGDVVALKLLHAGIGGSDAAERFVREAQLLAELRHPGIVAYVAHGQTPDGQRFLAMEWLDGIDVAQRLSRGPMPLRDALLTIQRVAEALTVAHERGIVHRDLKPSNLFLSAGDIQRCKLLDFGIARHLAKSKVMTRTGMVVGTPEYMAPEQARGARDLTAATDIFSLGCILYECLTGDPPFVAEHIAAVLVRILFEEPAPISTRLPGIPDAVVSLIRDMLNKDPIQRIADAAALAQRLSALGELPELPLLPTLAGSARPISAFAESEQVLFSLVVASAPQEAAGSDSTAISSEVLLDVEQRAGMLSTLRAFGVRAEFLIGGALIATVPQTGSARDQAILAARVGLLIKERWSAAEVVVATGRGISQGVTAVGEVADRAAGLLKRRTETQKRASDATASGVWIDELSADLLGPEFAVTTVAEGRLLIGEEREADRSRPLLGKPTPCVGRDAELAALDGLLTSCIEDAEARVAIVTAPPGVGKSRLRHEFLRRVEQRSERITLVLGRGDLMRAGAPYAILGHAIRRLCGLSGSEPMEEQRIRLRERIGEHVSSADKIRMSAFIGEMAGVPFSAEGTPMLQAAREDPRIMRDSIRRAFLDWLAVACRDAPVLLVLDDLQWGDALTVSLLDEALREQRGGSLMVLSFGRPELYDTFPRLWQNHKRQELVLRGLSKKACERLVEQTLGKSIPPIVMARIIEQSAGNALFLEELIRAAAEGQTENQVTTVVAMVQARIGRFEAGPRRAIRAASVFGQTFWAGGLERVLGLPKDAAETESWLGALVDAEVIERHVDSRLPREKEYGFRHALVREAVYELLTGPDLESGHKQAGSFLEEAGERDTAVIAEHYQRGGENGRAAELYSQAAERDLNTLLPDRVIRWVERGIACGAAGSLRDTLRGCESMAYFFVARIDRLYLTATQALPQTRPGSRAWARTLFGACIGSMWGPPEWKSQFPGFASMLFGSEPDPDAMIVCADTLSLIAGALAVVATADGVQPFLSRLESICQRAAERDPSVMRYYRWAKTHSLLHHAPTPWTTLQGIEEVLQLCQQAGDLRLMLATTAYDGATTWAELGDLDRAIAFMQLQSKVAELGTEPLACSAFKLNLALLRWMRGDANAQPEALATAQALGQALQMMPLMCGLAQDILARVNLGTGQPAEAEAQAREACRLLEATPNFRPSVYATLIQSLLAQGKATAAVEVSEPALAILHRFGCVGYAEVELRLAISEAFHAAGNLTRARSELTETLRQIQLRADNIPDLFWKNSYLTRNPACARAQKLGQEWASKTPS